MGKCKAEGAERWKSKVGGANDGRIRISEVNGSSDIEGEHENSHRPIVGKCHEPTHQKPKLHFTVGDEHLYVGVLVEDDKIEGVRFNLADLCSRLDDSKASPLNGEEDWVAVKVPTLV